MRGFVHSNDLISQTYSTSNYIQINNVIINALPGSEPARVQLLAGAGGGPIKAGLTDY